MGPEEKTCQNCKQGFVIEPEDFAFYDNIHVPPPTWCPECRLIRRLAFREERTIYKGSCKLCEKEIFSLYAPDSIYTAYCPSCWYGDGWEALEFGRDYDFNKTFFEQYDALLKVTPRPTTGQRKSVNCRYGNANVACKNLYNCFGAYFSEDSMYSSPIFSRNLIDSDWIFNGDHTYETMYSNAVYNTKYVSYSDECMDAAFLFDCKGCTNCFGCINLRGKKYYIFNKPYSKQEYFEKIKQWDLGDHEVVEKLKKDFQAFYYAMPHRYAFLTNVDNVIGDDVTNSKNCYYTFATKDANNCKYLNNGGVQTRDCYDISLLGDRSELCYESVASVVIQRCVGTTHSAESHDLAYCEYVINGSDMLGCAGVRNKQYCILNKQYTKEEYATLRKKIIDHMNTMPYTDRLGRVYRYGEMVPSEIAPFAYNESFAHTFFKYDKQEALDKGFRWQNREARDYKIDLHTNDLPNHIDDVDDAITSKIIECEHKGICNDQCATAFKIIPDELTLYKQMRVPLPRLCPNCRFYRRINTRNPLNLWSRACMCAGAQSDEPKVEGQQQYTNTASHFHGSEHCPNEFQTPYSPERREIVYCERCYQDEFV